MKAETWFTPEEAVAAKLADSVIEANTQRPKAKFDLSAFARAPLQPEPAPAKPDPAAVMAARQRRLAVALHCL